MKITVVKHRLIIFILSVIGWITISGCGQNNNDRLVSILVQLPDQKRTVLLPDVLVGQPNSNSRILSFAYFDSIQTAENIVFSENEFYNRARSLGVQYIVISSRMTNDDNHNFPWITNRNFRICPGDVDHRSDDFYTLLVWDNSIESYHFFKFLY